MKKNHYFYKKEFQVTANSEVNAVAEFATKEITKMLAMEKYLSLSYVESAQVSNIFTIVKTQLNDKKKIGYRWNKIYYVNNHWKNKLLNRC